MTGDQSARGGDAEEGLQVAQGEFELAACVAVGIGLLPGPLRAVVVR